MKKNKIEKLDLDLYEETLSNGLRVFIVPKDNVNSVHVTLSTKFGSTIKEFISNSKKEYTKVPLGVAHFLEHKMFEQENAQDPFTFYSQRGCDSNANTSNYKTTYLFSGSNAIDECLNYLLDYVQSPYFTDDNVQKEKGIIEQEINMYKDNPFFRIYDGIIYNSFIEHPIKYPIAGTVEDINVISKEDLYECYNAFYTPSNMFLVITGNVDPDETIHLIKINQSDKKFSPFNKVNTKIYDEPNKVAKKSEEVSMDIEISKLGIGYKIDCSKIEKNIYDIKTYLSILFDLKLGSTSLITEQLKKDNLITSDLELTFLNTDKHILVLIIVETNNTNKVLKLIDEELKNLKIEEKELERKKKVKKSGCIYRSDNIYSINNKIMSNIMNYDKVILDDYKKIDDLNIKEMNKIIKSISLSNKTTYIINKS